MYATMQIIGLSEQLLLEPSAGPGGAPEPQVGLLPSPWCLGPSARPGGRGVGLGRGRGIHCYSYYLSQSDISEYYKHYLTYWHIGKFKRYRNVRFTQGVVVETTEAVALND